MRKFFASIARRALRPILTPIVLLSLYAIRPFIRLHIFELTASALGEIIIHIDLYLRRKSLGQYGKRDLFVFFCGPPANLFIQQLLANHVTMVTNLNANRLFGLVAPAIMRTPFYATSLASAATGFREFNLGTHDVALTEEEIERGAASLGRFGIRRADWFVPIHARDRGFHQTARAHTDSRYHDYRNSDINNYRKAIECIIGNGGHVVRMGKHVAVKLNYRHDRVIDLTDCHDDFMDAYLTSQCRFMISGNSGTSHLAHLFGVPFGVTNMTPYGDMPFKRHSSLYIPKLMRRKNGDVLSFRELREMGLITGNQKEKERKKFYRAETYAEMGVEWVENSEDDILDLCLDMFDLVEGRSPTASAGAAQRHFVETYFGDVPEIVEFAGGIGPRFALKYSELM